MMFQGTHFRSSKATTTTSQSDIKVANNKRVTGNRACSETPPGRLFYDTRSLKRIIIAVASFKLSSSSTSTTTTVTTTTTSTSTGAHLKSLVLAFYYIIAFISLLILILYLNRFASQNLHKDKVEANARGAFMLSSSWPGMVAILSSAEMAASALNKELINEKSDNQDNSSSSNDNYLIRIKRSLTRDNKNNKNSSSIFSQVDRTATGSYQSVATPGGPQQGKTSAKRDNQHSRLLLKTRTSSQVSLSSEQLKPHQLQVVSNNLNADIPLKDLDLMSTLELQRRTPARVTEKQQHQVKLIAKSSPLIHGRPATSGAVAPISNMPGLTMELTERQANNDNHSANNRGAINLANSSLNIPTAQRSPKLQAGHWIPIIRGQSKPLTIQSQLSSTRDPYQARPGLPGGSVSALESSSMYRQADNSNNLNNPSEIGSPMVTTLLSSSSSSSNRPASLSYRNQHYHDYHHDHPAHQHRPNRHWRRPRLNTVHQQDRGAIQPPGKMYKRVLLCDKTLVSLDYVKRGHYVPLEVHFELDGNDEFDDNIIDLGSNLNQIFTSASDTNRRAATNTNASDTIHLAESVQTPPEEVVLDVERRSYLNDEDPLVKCDMWDLEKGLKNRKPPREILQMAIKADFDSVRDAINRCRQLSERTLPPDDEYRDGIVELMSTEDLISLFSMKRGLLPGTKWCGLGDQASSYNDLGPKHRIDICCRAHDHCPIRLKPFRNDYGVINIGLYTKSHCDCDADFYRCLREAHSRTADMLGNLYFNVMKLQCMREERMKICREMK